MFASGVATGREASWVTGSMAACVVIALLGCVARVIL